MKTLREHLLKRSREAVSEGELTAMRERVARRAGGDAAAREAHASGWALNLTRMLWRELVWPCRGAWAIIAAGWVAVLVLNQTGRAGASGGSSLTSRDAMLLAMMTAERSVRLFEGEKATPTKQFRDAPSPEASEPSVFFPNAVWKNLA